MLEKYFMRLANLDRIRGSWIGPAIEKYVAWLDERRYAARVVFALLESGVDLNVIRGWLGHADISTTNHYAEINTKSKEAALRACDPLGADSGFPRRPVWRNDETLLTWLASL